jgi:shikimate dehydrogenase
MTIAYAEVIGDPIAHSKSPLIHNFWLNKLGLVAEYRACHVRPAELAAYLTSRRADPLWRGCNVTIPHKLAVLDLVADPGGVRATIGAMNTLFYQAGALVGTNSDAAGFYTPIADLPLAGETAIVIGSGGAAHAVLFALAKAEIGKVTLIVRNPLKGAALLSRFGLTGEVKPLAGRLPSAKLLINASPLGQSGQPPLPIDLSPLPADALVYDLVYAPLLTDLLAQAEARGLATVDGLEMLVGQAALAFELFFAVPAPRQYDSELRESLLA